MLTELYPTLKSSSTPQEHWEYVKTSMAKFIKQYCRQRGSWRQKQLKALQSKRNRFLHDQQSRVIRAQVLPTIESQISVLQKEITDILAIWSGTRWREHSEVSAGYLQRTIQQRQTSRYIAQLQHPSTGEIHPDPEGMQRAASVFYQSLYTMDEVDDDSIDLLLNSLSQNTSLNNDEAESLYCDFEINELRVAAKRSPKQSSPGDDGLSYSFFYLLFQHLLYENLITKIYNQACQDGIFPKSWQHTCLILLPKKGDLSLLRNWRPLSLINCDAKLFTRLINKRIINVAQSLITPFQTGFLPNRFIAKNGLLVRLMMEQAKHQQHHDTIGLMLDFEKAYDRLHPVYLSTVLKKFGFPTCIINSICNLFFSTQIRININGHLSSSITQHRGLRQGDPLSPILFNLALEPLLQSILRDQHFQGILPMLPPTIAPHLSPRPIHLKVLGYADDVFVFLHPQSDLERLDLHLSTYQKASNAKLNP
ncbi:hypothetical protein INT45_010955 [Circinella minor]|uniref:Reverse transcriptase domain-containing protein n=1 Tax=Circinella minor TaxID=1195481 RepID=A0A8H7RMZ6_9FUNG|nr:hypothetical protein INT45_010955 [Circinella minor]